MGARLRSWWQKIKRPLSVIGIIAVSMFLVTLIVVEARLFGTGFTGKTLWDWLQLLIIPVVLAVGGYVINLTISRGEQEAARQRAKIEREITEDNQREAALQAYFDKMSELLLREKLRESKPEEEVRTIARVRTLTVLPRLDGVRKRGVLQFLYQAGLIERNKSIIDLQEGDLTEVNLTEINLSGANLRGVNLTSATLWETNLHGADLAEANLSNASLWNATLSKANLNKANLTEASIWSVDLTGVNLTEAILQYADLTEADLRDANLSEAYLYKTNLSRATITPEQLANAKSLKGATMPDGSVHP